MPYAAYPPRKASDQPPGAYCSPRVRSAGEARVRVLKEATKTERVPVLTGMPAWVTSPPNTRAVPGFGVSTAVGAPSGTVSLLRASPYSSIRSLSALSLRTLSLAQKPVPPPVKSSVGAVSGMRTVSAM